MCEFEEIVHRPIASLPIVNYIRHQTHGGIIVMNNSDQGNDLLTLTTEIVAAHVSNNTVAVGDLPQLINQVYSSLANIGSVPAMPAAGRSTFPASMRIHCAVAGAAAALRHRRRC